MRTTNAGVWEVDFESGENIWSDESREDYSEPRSNYYYVDRERREYRSASPRPRRMIRSTKPNYTRWLQPAEIEEEIIPEGEDPDDPNYTPSEAEELRTGRAWPNGPRGPMAWQRVGSHPGSTNTSTSLYRRRRFPRIASHRAIRAFLSLSNFEPYQPGTFT